MTRLIDMGVEPFLITSTVHAILAQRLIRRLCPQCRAPFQPTDEDLAALHLTRSHLETSLSRVKGSPSAPLESEGSIVHTAMTNQMTLMRPGGCAACQGLGFQGRVGLYELLPMNDAVRPLVLKRASVSEVREAARGAGMLTLREDGLGKALRGDTTLEEILRETQDYDAQQ